ncbi:Crp/Fnr family transcriptional regulator [Paenibacillus algorifonticola]|uniref:Crp/Fnr family transcriptional regulator n=1 Tax=Paenibacillus algorifonticola TaxID=684063 RepID=UPI003D2B0628
MSDSREGATLRTELRTDTDSLERIIQGHGWLKEMFDELPEQVQNCWEVRRFHPGETVCDQASDMVYVYILISGELAVERKLSDGKMFRLAMLLPGDVIGDIEISLDMPFINQVETTRESTLLALDKQRFKKWVINSPAFLHRLNDQLANKLFQQGRKTLENSFYSMEHKLLAYFYEALGHADFQKKPVFELIATREEMARQLGVAVRSVNRIMKMLKEEKLFVVKKGRLLFTQQSKQSIEQMLNSSNRAMF